MVEVLGAGFVAGFSDDRLDLGATRLAGSLEASFEAAGLAVRVVRAVLSLPGLDGDVSVRTLVGGLAVEDLDTAGLFAASFLARRALDGCLVTVLRVVAGF